MRDGSGRGRLRALSGLGRFDAPQSWLAADRSFPSNHVTIAVAAAIALMFAGRRTGIGALGTHDVLAGAVLGAIVTWAGGFLRTPLAGSRGLR